jgi:hypothetical protein
MGFVMLRFKLWVIHCRYYKRMEPGTLRFTSAFSRGIRIDDPLESQQNHPPSPRPSPGSAPLVTVALTDLVFRKGWSERIGEAGEVTEAGSGQERSSTKGSHEE